MRLPSTIRFKDEATLEAFYSLERGDAAERKLFLTINNALDKIERNAFCGIQIPKKLIPKEYDVRNLWKYDLPSGWRLLYSVINEEILVISLVIEWLDHKRYEQRLKY